MTTKYNIGEVVMIPATVEGINIDSNGRIYYDFSNITNNMCRRLQNVSEENIIDSLDEYYNPTTELHHVHD